MLSTRPTLPNHIKQAGVLVSSVVRVEQNSGFRVIFITEQHCSLRGFGVLDGGDLKFQGLEYLDFRKGWGGDEKFLPGEVGNGLVYNEPCF